MWTTPKKLSNIRLEAVRAFIDQQKWRLYRLVKTSRKQHLDLSKKLRKNAKETVDTILENSKISPTKACKIYISRYFGYWFFSAFLLLSLMPSISLGTFSIKVERPDFRLQSTYLLIMTSIQFKWIVNRSMPAIHYLTSLDIYHFICIVIICSVGSWHAIVGKFVNSGVWELEHAKKLDTAVLIGLGSFTFFFNIGFLIWYFYATKLKRKVIKMEGDYLEMNQDYLINPNNRLKNYIDV